MHPNPLVSADASNEVSLLNVCSVRMVHHLRTENLKITQPTLRAQGGELTYRSDSRCLVLLSPFVASTYSSIVVEISLCPSFTWR